MFGFSFRGGNRDRAELEQRFDQGIAELRLRDAETQVAVGHAINLANSLFIQRFGSADRFRRLTFAEKRKYAEQLNEAQGELLRKGLTWEGLGFMLFKSWVITLAANGSELERRFSKELASLSRQGDLSPDGLAKRAAEYLNKDFDQGKA